MSDDTFTRRALLTAVAVGAGAIALSPGEASAWPHTRRPIEQTAIGSTDTKVCAGYAGAGVADLGALSQTTGIDYHWAMVFNNASPDWAAWSVPWSVKPGNTSNLSWGKWKTAVSGRRLIITQDMIPNSESITGGNTAYDWRQKGASGAFDAYAATFAQTLIANGCGDSIIRLGHEMNLPSWWDIAYVGDSRAQQTWWAIYFRNIVTAMRSIPGAAFEFDFCINAAVAGIPLDNFYPGDSYVDIIGIDQYDVTSHVDNNIGQTRLNDIRNQPTTGLGTVLVYAAAHHKPLGFGEWGLWSSTGADAGHGGGDDPAYVNWMANIFTNHPTRYECWFEHGATTGGGLPIATNAKSLARYRYDLRGAPITG